MRYPGYGRWRTGVAACLVIVALLAVGAGTLWALTTAGFQLSWWTVDGGGGRSEGSGFVLSGTAGQPDAGLLIGPGYTPFTCPRCFAESGARNVERASRPARLARRPHRAQFVAECGDNDKGEQM
jgi:hypothetical protein